MNIIEEKNSSDQVNNVLRKEILERIKMKYSRKEIFEIYQKKGYHIEEISNAYPKVNKNSFEFISTVLICSLLTLAIFIIVYYYQNLFNSVVITLFFAINTYLTTKLNKVSIILWIIIFSVLSIFTVLLLITAIQRGGSNNSIYKFPTGLLISAFTIRNLLKINSML